MKLRRPDVSLRVTKFVPDPKPVAGLTPEARQALHERREAETRKVEPALEWMELRRDFNIFMYGNFVEVVDIGPLEMGPLEPPPHRCDSIDCLSCWNMAVAYNDYRKQKALRDKNGF